MDIEQAEINIEESPPTLDVIEEEPSIEEPTMATAPKKKRTSKQEESVLNARTQLAKKRKASSDLARSQEIEHLKQINELFNENIALRQRCLDVSIPPPPPPVSTPVEPSPSSPVQIEKPREHAPPMVTTRDLLRSMGM